MTGGGFILPDSSPQNDSNRFKGHPHIYGPSFLRFPLLTISFLGVQIFWSVEMSYASPYLLSLGLSKSDMAMVFLAGPLSGLIMQPLIGVLADGCTSRWGRRRPYMLGGSLVCVAAMLLLGWTKEVAGWFTSKTEVLTMWLAVLSIYLIDFSINAVQAVDRALLVDTLPAPLQPSANAWAARMLGVGSVVGFFFGNLNLPKMLPFLGKSQLQVLSILGSLILFATQLNTAVMVKERMLLKDGVGGGAPKKSFKQELKDIFTNIWTLPRVIRQICIIQFFSWIAWFPVLFYTTMYIGDLNKQAFYTNLLAPSSSSPASASPTLNSSSMFSFRANEQVYDVDLAALDADSTRLGSRALFYSSILSLAINLILPFFVLEGTPGPKSSGIPPSLATNGQSGTNDYQPNPFYKPQSSSWRDFEIPDAFRIHLASLWAFSHAIFTGCMFATFFISSVPGASILITITGFSWAVTQWVPFSLLADAILTEPASTTNNDDAGSIRLTDTRSRRRSTHSRRSSGGSIASRVRRDSNESYKPSPLSRSDSVGARQPISRPMSPDSGSEGDESDTDIQERKARDASRKKMLLGNLGAGVSRVRVASSTRDYGTYDNEDEDEDGEDAVLVGGNRDRDLEGGEDVEESRPTGGLSAKAGIILGIHNVFVVLPQFLVTGLAALIFSIFDPQKSVLHGSHPGKTSGPPLNATETVTSSAVLFSRDEVTMEDIQAANSQSVVYIFRIGGFSALIAFVLCCRLARELRHR